MKHREEMTEHELLIRIDERTEHLPDLTKKVHRHELVITIVVVVLIFVTAKLGWTFVTEAIAKAAA